MSMTQEYNYCLIGNPNSGKSSIFNCLTGLKQKIGNFPGVTVEKKEGFFQSKNSKINLVDLPGTYSLYPRKEDEIISFKYLMEEHFNDHLTGVVLVTDATNIKRNLLLGLQIKDLGIPMVMAITMHDVATKKGIKIDFEGLSKTFQIPYIILNPLKNKGLQGLKNYLSNPENLSKANTIDSYVLPNEIELLLKKEIRIPKTTYFAWQMSVNHNILDLPTELQQNIEEFKKNNNIPISKIQAEETLKRYEFLNAELKKWVIEPTLKERKMFTEKLDNILISRTWGYLILTIVMLIVFQMMFWLAEYPKSLIEDFFVFLQNSVHQYLPNDWWEKLIEEGLLAGLSGVAVFIPQIMILFGLITFLEDSGYMARISFLMDRLLRKVGLNGKSIMPMISGFACAVPSIISCRNIENKKERLLTIFILPLMSCSARLPVYTILISVFVPEQYFFGFLSLQGLIIMLFYILGVLFALLLSWVLKKIINSNEKSFFILELPLYKIPRWKNIATTMFHKASFFLFDAGKIILLLSFVLWFLNSNGPSKRYNKIQQDYEVALQIYPEKKDSLTKNLHSLQLENSYTGIVGKWITPVFEPIGFDWKMDIALLSSFVAREVFVSTMATLYSFNPEEPNKSLESKLQKATAPNGKKLYSIPVCLSLLVFYALALQCISTIVMVYKEVKSYKIIILQFVTLSSIAYFLSWVTFNIANLFF